jgi:UDP-glucose 4-epimerase
MNVLVTGAAGYIGSIVTRELLNAGHRVTALDNLEKGHLVAVAGEADFVRAEAGDTTELERIFRQHDIDTVFHLAARSLVGESMTSPEKYFRTNVAQGISLLDVMLGHGVKSIVFSSSAAVYGHPESQPITEGDPTRPVNPYGESKLMFEKILEWYGLAHGFKFVSLRYFNAAGATENLGEDHRPETHLIPIVLKVALGELPELQVFGRDYPTPDGSCVRDYVHVTDIARAHLLAMDLLTRTAVNRAYNLGSQNGHSVLEVIEAARRVTGAEIPITDHPRRAGDPPVLLASSELASAELSWYPEHNSLESIIESAWKWHCKYPHGYPPLV